MGSNSNLLDTNEYLNVNLDLDKIKPKDVTDLILSEEDEISGQTKSERDLLSTG